MQLQMEQFISQTIEVDAYMAEILDVAGRYAIDSRKLFSLNELINDPVVMFILRNVIACRRDLNTCQFEMYVRSCISNKRMGEERMKSTKSR